MARIYSKSFLKLSVLSYGTNELPQLFTLMFLTPLPPPT